MTPVSHSNKAKNNRKAIAALTLLLTAIAGAWQSAVAQDAASAGSYSAANALGPDQDSLLPPEVVPLDPATANSLTAKQAAARMSDSTGATGNVPGLVNNGQSGMQTAQDFRSAAFNSLYNQGQVTPPNAPATQWRAGQLAQNTAPGQSPTVPGYASYQQPSNTLPAQSQTLTGGPKTQPKRRDIRRAGFSNTLSAIAGFGAGAMTAGYLFHPQYMPMGLGVFGATMTGFGVRNAFRF